MIGLSSEVLVENIIKQISKLFNRRDDFTLKKNLRYVLAEKQTLKDKFDKVISEKKNISQKYSCVNEFIEWLKELENIKNIVDISERDVFFTFLRLNGNDVSHCFEIKKR